MLSIHLQHLINNWRPPPYARWSGWARRTTRSHHPDRRQQTINIRLRHSQKELKRFALLTPRIVRNLNGQSTDPYKSPLDWGELDTPERPLEGCETDQIKSTTGTKLAWYTGITHNRDAVTQQITSKSTYTTLMPIPFFKTFVNHRITSLFEGYNECCTIQQSELLDDREVKIDQLQDKICWDIFKQIKKFIKQTCLINNMNI